ncbi:hypothetical protein BDP55DRAFT_282749 [Colletotrichum godetiae]|uniref:Uncharacterized protein n=1 Tax=Colletotrichum godetiae TaxID=1209918 RepID=A0AAJ0AEX4_9PEZI|nr:uncharacterized protein BDP55DRAFT_282749 [Colletotrichum godetiae]KAK1671984.1 hypothetical protein BDP55DRAFT_282749 [Colletotrichum godetiae]
MISTSTQASHIHQITRFLWSDPAPGWRRAVKERALEAQTPASKRIQTEGGWPRKRPHVHLIRDERRRRRHRHQQEPQTHLLKLGRASIFLPPLVVSSICAKYLIRQGTRHGTWHEQYLSQALETIDIVKEESTMASLGRSFKPPAYLRARSRPAMTGRTLSNSSDISVVSTGSRSDADDLLMSGLNTPAHEISKSGEDGFKMPTAPDLYSPKVVTSRSTKISRVLPHALNPPEPKVDCLSIRPLLSLSIPPFKPTSVALPDLQPWRHQSTSPP